MHVPLWQICVLNCTQYIKQNAYNQLVTTGSEGKFGEQAFKEIHSLSSIDFACAHVCLVQRCPAISDLASCSYGYRIGERTR